MHRAREPLVSERKLERSLPTMQSLQQYSQVPVDDLDQIVSALYVKGEVGARCGLYSPWDMASEERADASVPFQAEAAQDR